MQTDTGRFRCHEASGPEQCQLCDEIGEDNMERDFLATVNMLAVVERRLRGQEWPVWLRMR